MRNKKGFTLIEILITLIVASILVLAMGAISHISLTSYKRLRDRASIMSDVMYAFKFIQNRVHAAHVVESQTVGTPWVGGFKLICNNSAFGIYGTYLLLIDQTFLLLNPNDIAGSFFIFF